MPGSGDDNDDEDDGGGGGGLADHLWQAKHFHGDIALLVMDIVVDVDLLTIFSRTGRPSIVMGEDQPPFIWDHVNAANASHLNIGNMMMMDQVLSHHVNVNRLILSSPRVCPTTNGWPSGVECLCIGTQTEATMPRRRRL